MNDPDYEPLSEYERHQAIIQHVLEHHSAELRELGSEGTTYAHGRVIIYDLACWLNDDCDEAMCLTAAEIEPLVEEAFDQWEDEQAKIAARGPREEAA